MENEFKDIYYKIYNENNIAHIEKLYRKRSLNILRLFGITMLGCVFSIKTLLITLPVFIIYLCTSSSKKQLKKEEEYKNLYKEKLILPLLQEIFEDAQYIPNEGMALDKYLEAEYKDNFINVNAIDKYSSNDHIILPIKIDGKNIGNFDLYDVKLETKKNRHNRRLIIFEGLTSSINLSKNVETKIKLNPNVISNFINSSKDKNTVSTEVAEFNKYFNILAENEVMAMRIFTPDIMEKIIKILKDKNQIFNINIINEKLYVRTAGFASFEPVLVLGPEKHMHVETNFTALAVMKELVCFIYKIIDDMEI